MAGIFTIDPRSSMETLYEEYLHTVVRLHASSDADVKALAAPFETWEEAWWTACKKEKGLLRAVFMAAAVIDRIDDQLDTLSDNVAVLARLEDKANKLPALMPSLYGSLIPSTFKRPLLGAQFDSMKKWPAILGGAQSAPLQAYAPTLQGLLTEGDDALAAARTADQQSQEFRLTGDRRVLADNLNSLRKGTHGKLGEIAHQKKYGNTFAGSFFRRQSAVRDLTLDEVERRLAAAQGEVERLQAKRAELLAIAELDAKARAEAEHKAKLAALQEAEKLAAEAAAQVAALQAELAGKPQ